MNESHGRFGVAAQISYRNFLDGMAAGLLDHRDLRTRIDHRLIDHRCIIDDGPVLLK